MQQCGGVSSRAMLLKLEACMAARRQLKVGRLRCGRSVRAEDVSGKSGLPIGSACIGAHGH